MQWSVVQLVIDNGTGQGVSAPWNRTAPADPRELLNGALRSIGEQLRHAGGETFGFVTDDSRAAVSVHLPGFGSGGPVLQQVSYILAATWGACPELSLTLGLVDDLWSWYSPRTGFVIEGPGWCASCSSAGDFQCVSCGASVCSPCDEAAMYRCKRCYQFAYGRS